MHEHELQKNAIVKGQILFVCTSTDSMGGPGGGAGQSTGAWLSEIAVPYVLFKEAGYDVTIASIRGGNVLLDGASLEMPEKEGTTREVSMFQADATAQQQLHQSVSLSSQLSPSAYKAIYLVGGHGAMFDFPEDPALIELLEKAFQSGTLVVATCHGSAGLVNVHAAEGKPVVKGLKITGFTDAEEESSGKSGSVPFMLETRLRNLGADFITGPKGAEHVEVAPNLITGQNNNSSRKLSEAVIKMLSQRQYPAGTESDEVIPPSATAGQLHLLDPAHKGTYAASSQMVA